MRERPGLNNQEQPLTSSELAETAQRLLDDYAKELDNSPEFKDALCDEYFDSSKRERSDLHNEQIVFERNDVFWGLRYVADLVDRKVELILTRYTSRLNHLVISPEVCEEIRIIVERGSPLGIISRGEITRGEITYVTYVTEEFNFTHNRLSEELILPGLENRDSDVAVAQAERILDDFRAAGSQKGGRNV